VYVFLPREGRKEGIPCGGNEMGACGSSFRLLLRRTIAEDRTKLKTEKRKTKK